MFDLQRLAVFAAVADTMSFSLAAARLDVSTSHVSKQISALEEELHSRLLHRTTRSISLTEAGHIFHQRCKAILSDIAAAEQEVLRRHESPQGMLRVTAPPNLANARLGDIVESFMSKYPDIELDLILSNRFFDLAEESIDIALRVVDDIPMNVYARRLCRVGWSLVGSPDYLKRRKLRDIGDLSNLDCLFDTAMSPRDMWIFRRNGQVREIQVSPRVRCGNSEWLRQCALRRMGVALLPDFMIEDDLSTKRLVRVLPDYQAMPQKWLYGIYLPNRYLASKVRLFLDAVEHGLQQAA
ncbi:LysR family transcriptional regulator [Noviherbaspirillum aerium]|uniref:LysR family transcriptional regulator n=1 Tax=Noviherbaspirillum aerium TaxID=2588497 RepID=UPI00124C5D22|nr:LysR family transcriptional regulator [Noviherbaspirillum aerium]